MKNLGLGYVGNTFNTAVPSAAEHNSPDTYTKSPAGVPDGLISKQCSLAMRAYTQIDKGEKPTSMEDYVQKLIKYGKKPGKDFRIHKAKMPNHILEILNRNGDPIKTLHWDGDTKAHNLSGYEVQFYDPKTNKLTRSLSYDMPENRINYSEEIHRNIPQEHFTQERITKDTTVSDYIKLIESKGKTQSKDFFVEEEKHTDEKGKPDGVELISLYERDKNGKLTKCMRWYIDPHTENMVSQSFYNQDEKEFKRLTFAQDGSTSLTYYNLRK